MERGPGWSPPAVRPLNLAIAKDDGDDESEMSHRVLGTTAMDNNDPQETSIAWGETNPWDVAGREVQ